jgi:pyruvate/2-oxoglutarate dehydrogenase complex dihydrolipoamide dehydrogenase (E3) component
MEAALTAAKRGHRVILCEQENRLGGTLNIADTVSFKDRMKLYKDRMSRHVMENPNIEVRLGCKVTPELVEAIHPDALFAAIGAVPAYPPIPGLDGENVITGKDVHGKEAEVGQRVVIIGGGLVGAETGIHLLELGHQVTIVEMTDKVAADCAGSHHEACLSRLEDATILMNTKCVAVSKEGVTVEQDGQQTTLPADTVILAAGMKALTKEAYALGTDVVDFSVLGDAVKPGKIQDATRTGFFAAMNL